MKQLYIILIPSMAQGHTIPMLDMAKLFISRGLKATIIATPSFSAPITKAQLSGFDIGLSVTPFPPQGSSLPPNIVSFGQITDPDVNSKFLRAMELLQDPVEEILQQLRPNCLISDMFLPWTADSASKFGIPRLAFYGTGFFARCLSEKFEIHKPLDNVTMTSYPEAILVPGLPHELKFVISQLCPFFLEETANDFTRIFEKINESWKKTYGEVVNSFNELESAYANHYNNVIGRKAWGIGPLLLCSDKNRQIRGKESAIDEHECLAWLDSKKPSSVVDVCFGSLATFSRVQLAETAAGLEASGQDFIWVVRENEGEEEDWVPLGFEERVRNKGLIIRGWAPQVMILDHVSVGAFVTHCGWNSTLESVCAGVPMVTWPLFGEQFFNEKLVTEVLGTGVSVGNKRWMMRDSEGVERDAVARAVEEVMVGRGAAEMRRRAQNCKDVAKKAVEEGGSSYNNLNALIEELSNYVAPTKQDTN
ncbi:scopoletin glucosyltransferase-like [Salvia hispanica]|uniref:scopoletin glucosyltransferase-like n=1 Tax=Salvia hispanica TaxID=49212 RepID=UPI002009AF3F|nr:scopoletin glucosyltransferase-like [Salvia hispanica]